jgi:hypothetical protein
MEKLKRITQWVMILSCFLFILWLLISYGNVIAVNWHEAGEIPPWNCLSVLLRFAGV